MKQTATPDRAWIAIGDPDRSVELAWLGDRYDELRQYRGQWIAVDGPALVAHADDLTTLLRLATEAGHPNPLITAVPDEDVGSLVFRSQEGRRTGGG